MILILGFCFAKTGLYKENKIGAILWKLVG